MGLVSREGVALSSTVSVRLAPSPVGVAVVPSEVASERSLRRSSSERRTSGCRARGVGGARDGRDGF